MKAKRTLPLLIFLVILVGCKKELIKKPDHLIEKEKMANILCDLALLEAIRIQNPITSDSIKINSNDYIFKKYKIDSIQFSQSNIYYATDYKEYKRMFEEIKTHLDKNKSAVEALIKAESNKITAKKVAEEKLKSKKVGDSLKK